MLLLLEHTFLLLSHPSFTTKVFPVSLRFHRHSAAANPVGEDVSGVLVTPSAVEQIEAERQRAEQESLRADREREEKEKLIAYLRTKGLDPNDIS
jgi:hypothetical protein